MTFRNSILAGSTLIREAIQSQNYQAGVEGWQIASDGTAEFSDLTIRSSDGSGSTVVISNGTIRVLDGTGDVMVELDATGYRLYDVDGALVAEIKLDGGGARGGFYTRNFAFPQNIYAFLSGGQITSGPVDNSAADLHGFLQYVMTDSAVFPYAVQTLSTGAIDIALDDQARVQLVSERGQRPRVWVDGGSSAVPAKLTVTGDLDVWDTQWLTYVPALTGGGAATYSIRDGWYYKLGKMVFFQAYVVIGVAGSGATAVTITAPSSVYRGGRRQSIPGGVRDGGVAAGPVVALAFAGGSGQVLDRIVNSAGTDVTGALLTAGSIWTFEGWYRET